MRAFLMPMSPLASTKTTAFATSAMILGCLLFPRPGTLRAASAFSSPAIGAIAPHAGAVALPLVRSVSTEISVRCMFGRSTFRLRKDGTTSKMTSSDETAASSPSTDADASLDSYRNKNNINDQVFSAISADGGIKVTAATIRNMVNEFMLMHTMTAVPADAIGRGITCSLLLANGMQEEQTFQLTMNGDGPLRSCVTIANGKGEVRGYVGNPGLGDMTLQEAVGKGTVQVVKNHPDWPNPYNGITAIRDGDIDRDVGIYLAESEQRSCALAAATSVNGILCTAAGGYLVEQLPECSKETIERVEQNLATLVEKDGGEKLPTGLLLSGVTPLEIASIILDGLDMKPLQQMEPKPVCECSEERLFRALRLLSREEVDDILAKEEKIEARCQFCGKVYRMGPDEVAERFRNAQGDPSKDSDMNL